MSRNIHKILRVVFRTWFCLYGVFLALRYNYGIRGLSSAEPVLRDALGIVIFSLTLFEGLGFQALHGDQSSQQIYYGAALSRVWRG